MTLPSVALAQTGVDPGKGPEPQKIYSPYVQRTMIDANFSEGVYWGDTHLHTSLSTDAGMIGNTLGPEEAYRFALGEEIVTSSGQRARLIRPLDFLVISDHAENLGLASMIVRVVTIIDSTICMLIEVITNLKTGWRRKGVFPVSISRMIYRDREMETRPSIISQAQGFQY